MVYSHSGEVVVIQREVYVIVIQAASRIIRKYYFLELKPSEGESIKAARGRIISVCRVATSSSLL